MSLSLFEPISLGPLTLKNRIVMAPMTRSRATQPGNIPNDLMAEYYSQRASAGLIITEGAPISPVARGYSLTPGIYTEAQIAGWQKVTQAVHDRGGKIFIQLWHVGRRSSTAIEGLQPLAPSAIKEPDKVYGPLPNGELGMIDTTTPKAMDLSDIQTTVDDFVIAAKNAMRAGFDGVEIHGAHGYLIDQFFWKDTNKREDQYGGNLLKRAQFACDIVDACQTNTSRDFIVGIRISQWKQQDYDAKIADNIENLSEFLLKLASSNPDFFHCSTRRYWEPEFTSSSLNLAGIAKEVTKIPTITVGSVGLNKDFINLYAGDDEASFSTIEELENRLRNKEFDLVAIGRALLSDPNWANKIQANKENEIQQFNKSYVENYY